MKSNKFPLHPELEIPIEALNSAIADLWHEAKGGRTLRQYFRAYDIAAQRSKRYQSLWSLSVFFVWLFPCLAFESAAAMRTWATVPFLLLSAAHVFLIWHLRQKRRVAAITQGVLEKRMRAFRDPLRELSVWLGKPTEYLLAISREKLIHESSESLKELADTYVAVRNSIEDLAINDAGANEGLCKLLSVCQKLGLTKRSRQSFVDAAWDKSDTIELRIGRAALKARIFSIAKRLELTTLRLVAANANGDAKALGTLVHDVSRLQQLLGRKNDLMLRLKS